MSYRVLKLSLQVMNYTLTTGRLCDQPLEIPDDLRVIDARVVPVGGGGVLELLCFSRKFSRDPKESGRPVICAQATEDDWRAPEHVMRCVSPAGTLVRVSA